MKSGPADGVEPPTRTSDISSAYIQVFLTQQHDVRHTAFHGTIQHASQNAGIKWSS